MTLQQLSWLDNAFLLGESPRTPGHFAPVRAPLRTSGFEHHLVGDCLSPRQIIHAILDGARVGRAA